MDNVQKSPRLFVFVVGQMRTAEQTVAQFRANILDWPDTRILVQCPKTEAEHAAKIYQSEATDAWDPSSTLPPCMRYSLPFPGESRQRFQRIKSSFYFQLVRQFRAATVFADQIDFEQDWILKWRPDLMLYGQLDWRAFVNQPAALWLPQHNNFGGLNDQCALGPAKLMLPYLRRLERLDDYFADGGRIHPEIFLRWSLADQPVNRMFLPYCIHRGDSPSAVAIERSCGDSPDPVLIKTMRAAGVTVHLDLKSINHGLCLRKRSLIVRIWHRVYRDWIVPFWHKALSRCFHAGSLAASATGGSNP